MNSLQPSWRIVREWDEIIASTLKLKIVNETNGSRFLKFNIINKFNLAKLYNVLKWRRKTLTLRFIMTAEAKCTCFVDKNTIPVIIDFWLKEENLESFYKVYKDVKLVLVTNREVYEYLKKNNCPLNVEHWALSFPDQYAVTEVQETKEYEFCLFGRPNPFFLRMLEKYASVNSDFEYIINKGDINNRMYITNKGRFVASDTGRASYLDMIRKTKISCYSTPGIDESKKDSFTFNQVTPRLFEMICNSCMVIGHYPLSADTLWYDLPSIVPQVENYEQFEEILNHMRKTEFDYLGVSNFMQKHYTSKRSIELIKILEKYNIKLK